MEESYAHLQRQNVPSVSGSIDDTYEQIRVSVQPTGKRQMQSSTTTAVKVVLGLFGAVLLVAVVMAAVAIVQIAELKAENRILKQALQTKQTDIDLPQPPSTAVWTTTTPASPVLTTATPATPVQTATPPATPVRTTTTPTTTISPSVTCRSPDNEQHIKSSCSVIHTCLPDSPSGVHTIYPRGRVPGRSVWCEMDKDGGGWTLFQRRKNGSVAFNQTWDVYQRGFGSPAGEFWLGNDDLHQLTAAQPSDLRIDLWDWEGAHGYAKYSTFSVGNASINYVLRVAGYSGNISDSLTGEHNSQPFTTEDRDNDRRSAGNCATSHGGGGGWWYGICDEANLNGRYFLGGVINQHGVEWYYWRNSDYSYRAATMMVRPRT